MQWGLCCVGDLKYSWANTASGGGMGHGGGQGEVLLLQCEREDGGEGVL